MILVTLGIAAPLCHSEEMVKAFWLLLGPVRVEPGCLACRLYQEIGNGEELLYVEEWETAEHLERHMRSGRYERLLAIMEASTQPPVLRYHLVSAVKGLEYLEIVRLGRGGFPQSLPDKTGKELPPSVLLP